MKKYLPKLHAMVIIPVFIFLIGFYFQGFVTKEVYSKDKIENRVYLEREMTQLKTSMARLETEIKNLNQNIVQMMRVKNGRK